MRLLTASRTMVIFAAMILAAVQLAGSEGGGRLLVALQAEDGQFRVASASIFPGPEPAKPSISNATYLLYDGAGELLARGPAYLPRVLVHERTDENGEFSGVAEDFSGAHTLALPWHEGAAELELRCGGVTLLREELPPIGKAVAAPAPSGSPRPDFHGYIDSLKAKQYRVRASAPAADTSSVEEKIVVTGKVRVNKVKDRSLYFAQIFFHLHGDEDDMGVVVNSDSEGNYSAELAPGTYMVTANCFYNDPNVKGDYIKLYPGPKIIPEFDPSEQNRLNFRWRLYKLFRGRLVDEDGEPVFGEVYILERNHPGYTHQHYFISQFDTRVNGTFEARLPKKRFAMVALPTTSKPVGELLSIVKVSESSKRTKLVCPIFGKAGGNDLKKIWDAGPPSKKLNIVFLAEAYTDLLESFTDTNGNGIWDGDLLFDENGNGKRGGGESFTDLNRNGIYDAPEPFEDVNGDGICNRYERAKFEADCALNAAAVLNFHPFDDYDDAINIYTYWTPSKHGVQRFETAKPWKGMETAFGVYCYGSGKFQSCNISYSLTSTANSLLPNAKQIVPVAMVHDPFDILRANAVFNFGRIILSAEDSRAGGVLIHELGHSVGQLWDEYIYSSAYGTPNYEPSAANATIETNPALVKWADLIEGTPPVPTPANYEGYGLFEGAYLYCHGVYRPTEYSMMRSTSYPYFEVNARQMSRVLEGFR